MPPGSTIPETEGSSHGQASVDANDDVIRDYWAKTPQQRATLGTAWERNPNTNKGEPKWIKKPREEVKGADYIAAGNTAHVTNPIQ